MKEESQRPGLAARVGRWSSTHRTAAIVGWLVFVIAAAFLGGALGTKNLEDGAGGVGESKDADVAIERAFPDLPAGEVIFIQALKGGSNESPAFRAVIADATKRVDAAAHTQKFQEPQLSED